jgi:hypothetical protein
MAVVRVKLSDLTAVPEARQLAGSDVLIINTKITMTSGNSAGSIYEIANVPADYIPVSIDINSAAITGATDVDLGMYQAESDGGAVIDANVFDDDLDLASGLAIGSEANGLLDMAIASLGTTFREIAGDAAGEYQSYCLALTLNDASISATGDVYFRIVLVRG